jgi:Cdc6-like AAA superfamily ATPase
MKTIGELNLGFSDAQNYTQRANKDLFNNIFVKNKFLDRLLYPSTYFLIGEKGTGKTAYSVFLSNNNYKENKTIVSFISATDYEKFYSVFDLLN